MLAAGDIRGEGTSSHSGGGIRIGVLGTLACDHCESERVPQVMRSVRGRQRELSREGRALK